MRRHPFHAKARANLGACSEAKGERRRPWEQLGRADPCRGTRYCERITQTPNRREASMHAVIVDVSISDVEESQRELRERVIPSVSQVPGFVSGVWMEYGAGKGHSLLSSRLRRQLRRRQSRCARACPRR